MALAKSKGNLNAAIELLRKHVDVFMLDKVAWEELGELYLQVCFGDTLGQGVEHSDMT